MVLSHSCRKKRGMNGAPGGIQEQLQILRFVQDDSGGAVKKFGDETPLPDQATSVSLPFS
jgi:hypothetical protein